MGLLVQCVPDSEEDHVQAAFGYPSVLAKAKRRRPETCVGCGELMSCTQKELLVVKGRAVSALRIERARHRLHLPIEGFTN